MKATQAIRFTVLRRSAAVLALSGGALCAPSAQAALIAIDDFESYTAGTSLSGLNGGSGWAGAWTGASQASVQTITLVDPNGIVSGGTQALRFDFAGGASVDATNIASRTFASQSNTIYMGYQVRVGSFENDDFLIMQASNGATGNTQSAVGSGVRNATNNPFFVRVGDSGNVADTANSAVLVPDNTDFLVVAKYSKDGGSLTYNRADLYVNPVNLIEPGVPAVSVIGADPTVANISMLTARMLANNTGTLGDTAFIDSIRIATTYAEALTGTPAPGPTIQTLTAVADAHVQSGPTATTDDQNFGLQTVLQVKNAAVGQENFNRKTWIAFDTTSAQLGEVDEAALKLTISGSGGSEPAPADNWTFSVFGLRDDFVPAGAELDENWLETTITWNNAPGNAGLGPDVDLADVFGGAALDTFTILGTGATGDMIVLDDPAILNFLKTDTDGRVTFIVVRSTQEFGSNSVIHQFASIQSTSGTGPQLILTTNFVIPEPSVALLGLMGMSALGLRRRRSA